MNLVLLFLFFMGAAYFVSVKSVRRAEQRTEKKPLALPKFYGYLGSSLMTLLLTVLIAGVPFYKKLGVSNLYIPLIVGGGIFLLLLSKIMVPSLRARTLVEKGGQILFSAASFFSALITFVVVLLLFKESVKFFNLVSLSDFLFGEIWAPEISYSHGISAEEGVSVNGQYGALPLFAGTFLITTIALFVGGGLGLMVAIYTSQFAKPKTRIILKPALEILAGIPTVVYGFFALAVMAPALHTFGEFFHFSISSESALGAGLVMGLMILPIISSLSDDALSSLPGALKQNALAMGATSTEAIQTVLIPAAFPGILSAFLLAVSRATGETMLVLMAASLQPKLTGNPLEAVTTVTVQIVSLLTGDQEFESAKTLSAFALALVLFLTTLVLTILALFFVNRHAKRYEL